MSWFPSCVVLTLRHWVVTLPILSCNKTELLEVIYKTALITCKALKTGQQVYLRDLLHYQSINQLILWDPPVNYYSISWRQGSTFNPRLSVSLHQLSGTLWHLRKVPLPSPPSRHIWKPNCSLLHTTQSNISSAAGASDSNCRHMAQPINVFDIDIEAGVNRTRWKLHRLAVNIPLSMQQSTWVMCCFACKHDGTADQSVTNNNNNTTICKAP